jgi:large subunit ribosomal protein L10
MSKLIKQMEMQALKATFKDVRDLIVLSASKLSCQADNQLRATLRKKNIRLQMVKNSLTRRVFADLGMNVKSYWEGTTVLAWGGSSLAELSSDLEAFVKKNDKIIKVKGAISEGQEIGFRAALAMPTRAQALGRIVSLALSPASRLVSQIRAPGANLAGQIKTLSERAPAEPVAAEAVPAAAAGQGQPTPGVEIT